MLGMLDKYHELWITSEYSFGIHKSHLYLFAHQTSLTIIVIILKDEKNEMGHIDQNKDQRGLRTLFATAAVHLLKNKITTSITENPDLFYQHNLSSVK